MAEKQFSPGDIVELKSGSPKMTVSHYDEWGNVICSWYYYRTNELHRGESLQAAALKLSEQQTGEQG
jgi:uncharacterized protein YodC (DUF2158 family)